MENITKYWGNHHHAFNESEAKRWQEKGYKVSKIEKFDDYNYNGDGSWTKIPGKGTRYIMEAK